MLYETYLGINGSLFELKVLGLQFMTVLLQVGAEGSMVGRLKRG